MEIRRDGACLTLRGDFDVRSTWEVRKALYDHLAERPCGTDDVVVDLTDVHVIDLTALRVLAVAGRTAGRTGRQLVLRGCCPAVRRLLLISHLGRYVSIEREPTPASEGQ